MVLGNSIRGPTWSSVRANYSFCGIRLPSTKYLSLEATMQQRMCASFVLCVSFLSSSFVRMRLPLCSWLLHTSILAIVSLSC